VELDNFAGSFYYQITVREERVLSFSNSVSKGIQN
jgi:hypothetical protein